MNFAEEMNALAKNTNLEKRKEVYERAQALYEGFKSSIEHFARLGYYKTSYTMSPVEARKKDREDVLIALKNILIDKGFDVHSFNGRTFSFVVSWANATTEKANTTMNEANV
jgi:hypothetical protein